MRQYSAPEVLPDLSHAPPQQEKAVASPDVAPMLWVGVCPEQLLQLEQVLGGREKGGLVGNREPQVLCHSKS